MTLSTLLDTAIALMKNDMTYHTSAPKYPAVFNPRPLMEDEVRLNFDQYLTQVEDNRPIILRRHEGVYEYRDIAIILPMKEYDRLCDAAWEIEELPPVDELYDNAVFVPRPMMVYEVTMTFYQCLAEVDKGRGIILRREAPEIGYRETAIILPMARYEMLKDIAEKFAAEQDTAEKFVVQ